MTTQEKIRKLCIEIPAIANCPYADQFAFSNAAMFDEQAKNKSSVFRRDIFQDTYDRLEPGFAFKHYCEPRAEPIISFARDMLVLADWTICINQGLMEKTSDYMELMASCRVRENQHTIVSGILSVDEASASSLLAWSPETI